VGADYASKATIWKSAIQVAPGNPRIWVSLADSSPEVDTRLRYDRYKKALELSAQRGRWFAGAESEWPLRTGDLAMDLGLLDEARTQYRAALEHAAIESQRIAANVSLGIVYSLTGESDLAEQHLREALRLDADNVPHWKILAEHLARNQQFDKARAAWREASRLALDDPLIRSRFQALETQPSEPTEENSMRKS